MVKENVEPCIPIEGTAQCIPLSYSKAPRKFVLDAAGQQKWMYLKDSDYVNADILIEAEYAGYGYFSYVSLITSGILFGISLGLYFLFRYIATDLGTSIILPFMIGSGAYFLNAILSVKIASTFTGVYQYIGVTLTIDALTALYAYLLTSVLPYYQFILILFGSFPVNLFLAYLFTLVKPYKPKAVV